LTLDDQHGDDPCVEPLESARWVLGAGLELVAPAVVRWVRLLPLSRAFVTDPGAQPPRLPRRRRPRACLPRRFRHDTEDEAAELIASVLGNPIEERGLRDCPSRAERFTPARFVDEGREIVATFEA